MENGMENEMEVEMEVAKTPKETARVWKLVNKEAVMIRNAELNEEEWCRRAEQWREFRNDLKAGIPRPAALEEKEQEVEALAARISAVRAARIAAGIPEFDSASLSSLSTNMKEIEGRIAVHLKGQLEERTKEEMEKMEKEIEKLNEQLNQIAITGKMNPSEEEERRSKMEPAKKAALTKPEWDQAWGTFAAIVAKEKGVSVEEYEAGIDPFLTRSMESKKGKGKGKARDEDEDEDDF